LQRAEPATKSQQAKEGLLAISQTITEAKVMKSEKVIRQQIAEIQQQAERLRTTLQPLEKKRMGVELKFLRQALMVAEAGVTTADLKKLSLSK
jgi:hypothetical protein